MNLAVITSLVLYINHHWGQLMQRGLILFLGLGFAMLSCTRAPQTSIHQPEAIVNGNPVDSKQPLTKNVVRVEVAYKNPISHQTDISYCTGTFISKKYILTAAHCVKFAEILSARVIFPLAQAEEVFSNAQVSIHPDYSPDTSASDFELVRDLALIRLQKPVPAPYESLPLILSIANPPNTLNFVSLGFGQQKGVVTEKIPNTLELKLAIFQTTPFDPNKAYFFVDQPKQGICFGDSGAPGIVFSQKKPYVIAVATDVLFNPFKAFEPGYDRCLERSIFVNLIYFKDWLEEVIK